LLTLAMAPLIGGVSLDTYLIVHLIVQGRIVPVVVRCRRRVQ
jgi:hypothetical protein